MLRDRNPKRWKLLVFYYSHDEPRLIVAKRTGTALILNYRNCPSQRPFARRQSCIAKLIREI